MVGSDNDGLLRTSIMGNKRGRERYGFSQRKKKKYKLDERFSVFISLLSFIFIFIYYLFQYFVFSIPIYKVVL